LSSRETFESNNYPQRILKKYETYIHERSQREAFPAD
jgi:hypothetical protein